jgi:hypothetical protein
MIIAITIVAMTTAGVTAIVMTMAAVTIAMTPQEEEVTVAPAGVEAGETIND